MNTLNDLGKEHLLRKFVIRTNLSLRYIKVLHNSLIHVKMWYERKPSEVICCIMWWIFFSLMIFFLSVILIYGLQLSDNERRIWGEVLSIFKAAPLERISYPFSCHDKESFMQHSYDMYIIQNFHSIPNLQKLSW